MPMGMAQLPREGMAGGGMPEEMEAGRGAIPPPPSLASSPIQPTQAQLNPNMYISNTYMGGSGMKDRLEKLISEGVMVEGKRVKLEAFSRHYAQAFPIPTTTALNLSADTERSKIIQDGDKTFLQVGIQAIQGELPRRPPLNIALVMDRSGSMADENKMEFAKQAAAQLVDKLSGNDVFALVAFDNAAQVLLPAQKVSNKAHVKNVIAHLAPGGGTNIYDGLQLGYQEAQKHAARDGVNLVILLSDGQVTAGVTDPARFQQLVSAQVDRDIQTTSVGLGVQFNEDLMLSIARDGKGNYHFIKDGADTQKVFAKELDELTHIVAKALKLRIQLADGVGLVRVLGATQLSEEQVKQVKTEEKKIDRKVYEELGIPQNRQKDKDEPGIKVLIPNFYRGDSHVVMLEVSIPKGSGTRKVADVFLKYKDLVFKRNREAKVTVSVDYVPDRDAMIASINKNVKKNLLGFQTGEALIEAAALLERGRIADAVKKIDERMVVLGKAAQLWRDKDLDRDGKLLDRYKTVIAQLNTAPHLASGEFGQYLKKSLTYAGYQMTR